MASAVRFRGSVVQRLSGSRGSQVRATLLALLDRLDGAYDFSGWHWQAGTPPEYVCISALLVQHTNWSNVERALERLVAAGACSLDAMLRLSEEELAELVRPAGTPVPKARRLRALASLAAEAGGLDRLLALPTAELRARLLATYGIGPETADAIVLHAAGRPVFQIDAYTMRIFRRLGLGPEGDRYESWQRWFEEALPPDAETYRRYHGLLVLHGKHTCRPRPKCEGCCLLELCATGRERVFGASGIPATERHRQARDRVGLLICARLCLSVANLSAPPPSC